MRANGVLDEVWEELRLDGIRSHGFASCWAARLLLEWTDSGVLRSSLRRWRKSDCVGRVIHRVHAVVPIGFKVSSTRFGGLTESGPLGRRRAKIPGHVHVKYAFASSEADVLRRGACGLEGVEIISCDLHPLRSCQWSCDHLGELKLWSGSLKVVHLLEVVHVVNWRRLKRQVALSRPQIKQRLLAFNWLIRSEWREWRLLIH